MAIVTKAKSLFSHLKNHWNAPPQGRYMSFKEIFSLSTGGIGCRFIYYCINQMILSVGNTLIGNTIGISPSNIYVLYIIGVLSSFPLTALRARMIDNARSMKGKYRPFLITMGLPTVILGIIFIMAPYEAMSMFSKCAVVLICNIGFQFFFYFYNDAYDSLIYVLSPNSIERSDVLSIRSVIENLSPSIANIFLPIVAKLITGENTLYDLKVYRVLFPPMLLVGFLISMLTYVNTEEKIVQAKTHVIRIKFTDALRAVAKNKYFWIISLAGWIGFLENSFTNIMGWMYNYQAACTPAQYSIITAIAGNASFWPNLVAPFLIRKYGKKKILILTNLLNAGFIICMLPIVRMTGNPSIIWFLLFCTFINQFITSLGHLLNPSIQADIRDYQQYISGERIDGMFAAVGLIGSVITLATSSVLPTIYEKAGLNEAVAVSLGYSADRMYDVLYNQEYFISISSVLIFASVVGAVLNVIPLFFYNLTETDQKGMVNVLKIRALFEDYGNNVLKEKALIEAVEIINNAKEYVNKPLNTITKEKIAEAKKTKNKEAIKQAKEAYKNATNENTNILIAKRVVDELNKFDSVQGQASIEHAKNIVSAGLNGYMSIELPSKKEIKAMPESTESEREIRRNLLTQLENKKIALKAIKKYYPDGIEEFDNTVFEKLFKAEDEFELKLHESLKRLKKAKEEKDKNNIKELKKEVKGLQLTKREIAREIKKATNQNAIYYRAAKPYLDAQKLLKQAENYKKLDEINALYTEALKET